MHGDHQIAAATFLPGIAEEFLSAYTTSLSDLKPQLLEAFEAHLLSAYYTPVRLEAREASDNDSSYGQLAEHYGVSKTAISAWMHDKQYPGLESFSRLAAAKNAKFQPGFDVAADAYARSLLLLVAKLQLRLDASEISSDLILLLYHTLRSEGFYLWHATRSYRFLKQAFVFVRDITEGGEHGRKWKWRQAEAKQRINQWLAPWCVVEGCIPYAWF